MGEFRDTGESMSLQTEPKPPYFLLMFEFKQGFPSRHVYRPVRYTRIPLLLLCALSVFGALFCAFLGILDSRSRLELFEAFLACAAVGYSCYWVAQRIGPIYWVEHVFENGELRVKHKKDDGALPDVWSFSLKGFASIHLKEVEVSSSEDKYMEYYLQLMPKAGSEAVVFKLCPKGFFNHFTFGKTQAIALCELVSVGTGIPFQIPVRQGPKPGEATSARRIMWLIVIAAVGAIVAIYAQVFKG